MSMSVEFREQPVSFESFLRMARAGLGKNDDGGLIRVESESGQSYKVAGMSWNKGDVILIVRLEMP